MFSSKSENFNAWLRHLGYSLATLAGGLLSSAQPSSAVETKPGAESHLKNEGVDNSLTTVSLPQFRKSDSPFLILYGGADRPAIGLKKFIERATDPKTGEAHIVVLPWAAQSEEFGLRQFTNIKREMEQIARVKIEMAPLALQKPITLKSGEKSYFTEEDLAKVENVMLPATGFWVSGGDQNEITKITDQHPRFKSILTEKVDPRAQVEVLPADAPRGVVYGGTSAGTNVVAEWMNTGVSQSATSTDSNHHQVAPGLGFLRIGIDQHFSKKLREEESYIKGDLKGDPDSSLRHARSLAHALKGERPVIGIDENSCAIFEGGRVYVLAGKITYLDWRDKSQEPIIREMFAGESIDLGEKVLLASREPIGPVASETALPVVKKEFLNTSQKR